MYVFVLIGCQLHSAGRAFNIGQPTQFGVTNFDSILTQKCICKFGIFEKVLVSFWRTNRKLYYFAEQAKWMITDNWFYSDMENKTICGPAFHVCAPYRCKNKSLRDICVYSDMEHKMTGVWNLIKKISCGVSSRVKRHEL